VVGLFVRLKLRLLRNRLGGSSTWSVVGFVLVWTAALGTAVGLGLAVAAGGRILDDPRPIPPVLFGLVAFGWVIGPLIAASFDDMLDPRRFELLPLSRT
jgi:ABC-2 type transport system permease protein